MDTRKFKTSGVRPRPKTYAYVTVRRTGHGQLYTELLQKGLKSETRAHKPGVLNPINAEALQSNPEHGKRGLGHQIK